MSLCFNFSYTGLISQFTIFYHIFLSMLAATHDWNEDNKSLSLQQEELLLNIKAVDKDGKYSLVTYADYFLSKKFYKGSFEWFFLECVHSRDKQNPFWRRDATVQVQDIFGCPQQCSTLHRLGENSYRTTGQGETKGS